MINKQERLIELFDEFKVLTIKQISEYTGYRKDEIYRAIVGLKRKKKIVKLIDGCYKKV